MKIITWNCNMAYRQKANLLLAHKPDIVVVPQCEHPDKLKFEPGIPLPNDIFWFGSNQNKGLGVLSYSDYKFKLVKKHNPDYCIILPLIVSNQKFRFMLFAIWANNPIDKGFQYIGQIWKAINFYSRLLKSTKTLLIGDFNSNKIWDKPRRLANHSTVVDFLDKKGIYSTYHKFHNQNQGEEKNKTLFMYRHKDKSYHIDYCFASKDFIKTIIDVEVGTHRKWSKYSDHTPLIITFNI